MIDYNLGYMMTGFLKTLGVKDDAVEQFDQKIKYIISSHYP